jgi:hypothetical protein
MRFHIVLACLAAACYAASLVLPALAGDAEAPMRGINVLVLGPMAFLTGEFRWLANPWFIAACSLAFLEKRRSRLAIGLAAASLVLAFSCLLHPPTLFVGDSGSPSRSRAELLSGAYAWIFAHVLLLLATLSPRATTHDLGHGNGH